MVAKDIMSQKEKLKKQIKIYRFPIKVLKYSEVFFYLGFIVSILVATKLLLAITFNVILFIFFKAFYFVFKKKVSRKIKKLSEIDYHIFLQHKL